MEDVYKEKIYPISKLFIPKEGFSIPFSANILKWLHIQTTVSQHMSNSKISWENNQFILTPRPFPPNLKSMHSFFNLPIFHVLSENL